MLLTTLSCLFLQEIYHITHIDCQMTWWTWQFWLAWFHRHINATTLTYGSQMLFVYILMMHLMQIFPGMRGRRSSFANLTLFCAVDERFALHFLVIHTLSHWRTWCLCLNQNQAIFLLFYRWVSNNVVIMAMWSRCSQPIC